ncbi:hypothetical protein, partial [Sinorhizobium meliloti]
MATKKTNESIDEKAFQALEAALKIDFDDLKSALNDETSLEEPVPENVSETARQAAGSGEARAARAQQEAPKPARGAEAPRSFASEMAPKQPPLAPANDDTRKSPAAMLRSLEVRSSRAAIRVAAIISLVWTVAGLGVAHLLYAPGIWQIRSLGDLAAMPGAIGILLGIALPVMLFFSFAIMIARAQELRS